MPPRAPSSRWHAWLRALAHPLTRPTVALAGLPGHLRLPRGWKSQGRFAHEHLLYLVTEGHVLASLQGERLLLAPGAFVWVRPGTPFLFTRANPADLSLLRCRFRLAGAPPRALPPWPHRVWADGLAALPWIEWMIQEAEHPDPWSPARLRCLLGGLFTDLARRDTEGPAATGLTTAQRRALSELLATRPDARATPRELARAAGLSFDYFSRCFKRAYGLTPRRWLLEQRMRLAQLRLLETDRRMGEIARDLGYDDLFLFSRQFKAVTGLSPSAYRQRRSSSRPAA